MFRALISIMLLSTASAALGAGIHEAAARGDLTAVKQLLKADKSRLNAVDERGRTPLHRACFEGKLDVVKYLLDKGAPVGQRDTSYRLTPLHFAAWKGQVAVAKLLLSKGADLNAREMDNETALFYAAAEGHLAMTEFLMARGADINDTLSRVGNTVVSLALDRRKPEIVKFLVGKGATTRMLTRGESPANWTLLHTAAWECGKDMVDLLADHGVPVDQKTTGGRTPLHNACGQGNIEGAKALITRGADPNAATDQGQTPLFFAVNRGSTPLASMLVESGARVEGRDSASGRTLLHYAAIKGYGDIAGLLIDKGADVEAGDGQGKTALDRAIQYGQNSCASLLREKGAKSPNKQAVKRAIAAQDQAPKKGEAIIRYLGHSGWAVRTANYLLVFDYFKGDRASDNPSLANGSICPAELKELKVISFTSHVHGDHYMPSIFDWRTEIPDVIYVTGFSPRDKEGYVQLANRETRNVEGAEITTIESNDSGQGFLVKVDGVTILHPGDHANRNRDLSGNYTPEIDFLAPKAGSVDIMFVPVTGCNFGDVVAVRTGAYYAIRKLNPKAVFPMHGGEGGQQYREFAELARKEGVKAPVYVAEFAGDHWRLKLE